MVKKIISLALVIITVMISACSSNNNDSILNTLPTITSALSVSIAENQTSAYTITATDADGNNLIYSVSGTDADSFSIDSDSGVIAFKEAPDYETKNTYSITCGVSDGDLSVSQDVIINITDYMNPFLIAKLQASDAEYNDQFGGSVSVDGDYIVVGAKNEDTAGSNAGSAYVYKKQADGSLVQLAKLQSSDIEANDLFGASVSISGDYIVVGANYEDAGYSNAGSAYVFKRNSDANITQIAKIQASDAGLTHLFGSSVSISGNYIVVGTTNSTERAYLFKINSDTDVTQIAKIQASDTQSGDEFGISVSIDGDYIVVGAYFDDIDSFDEGSAYVFKRNSDAQNDVTQIAKIQASDAELDDNFGKSVSISGDYIVVGAYYEAGNNLDYSGSAYVFKRNSDTNVTQIAKLNPLDAELYDEFGSSVSISGNYIVVGAHYKATERGSAYVFKRNSDTDIAQISDFQALSPNDYDNFGAFVSISGENIVVGARYKDSNVSNVGAAYVYDLEAVEIAYVDNAPQDTLIITEELTTEVYTFEARHPNNDVLTYTLNGADAASFTMNGNILSFLSLPDYELPTDIDSNNEYSLTVILSDTQNNEKSINLDISVIK